MVLNYLLSYASWSALLLLGGITGVHVTSECFRTNLPDLLPRVLLNDSYINLYYFFWTNSWYLPTFFLCILIVTWGLQTTSVAVHVVVALLPLILVIISEIIEYAYFNSNLHTLPDSSNGFNTLLVNSINKYHPLLLYLVLISVLCLAGLLSIPRYAQRQYFTNARVLRHTQCVSYPATFVAVGTLFLGSWWALQEGSWGGWWNWDPSEVYGLVLLVICVRWQHFTLSANSVLPTVLLFQSYSYSLGLLYLFIQLNFDLVSHNFGTSANQFLDPTYGYLLTALLLLFHTQYSYTTFLNARSSLPLLYHVRYYACKVVNRSYLTLLTLFTTTLLYLSFIVLVNDFSWNFLSINIGNTAYHYLWVIIPIVLLLLTRTWVPHNMQVLVLVLVTTTLPSILNCLPLFVYFGLRKVALLHLILLTFFTVNTLTNLNLDNIWYLSATELVNQINFTLSESSNYSVTPHPPLLELGQASLTGNVVIETLYNFVWNDTSSEARAFAHYLSATHSSQNLFLGDLIMPFTVVSADTSIPSLTFTLLMFLAAFHALRSRNTRIVF